MSIFYFQFRKTTKGIIYYNTADIVDRLKNCFYTGYYITYYYIKIFSMLNV